MIALIIVTLVGGYASHWLRRYTDRISLQIWREQVNRVLGVSLVFPFALALHHILHELAPVKRFCVAFGMAFSLFGLGNTAARFLEALGE